MIKSIPLVFFFSFLLASCSNRKDGLSEDQIIGNFTWLMKSVSSTYNLVARSEIN